MGQPLSQTPSILSGLLSELMPESMFASLSQLLSGLNQAIANFHFARPVWFIALVPLAVLIFLLSQCKDGQGMWHKVIPHHFLPYLLVENDRRTNWLPLILLSICWAVSVIAISGPAWRQLPQTVERRIDAQIILLDLSQSMNAIDLSPNRITRAKHKLSDLLAHRNEGITSLIVYAGSAHVVIPLTDDIKTIEAIIPTLDPDIMPLSGSNPIMAVQEALAMLERGEHHKADIILLTDGIKVDEIDTLTELFTNDQFSLSILGIGTKDGAPIPLSDGSYLKDASGGIVIPKLTRKPLQLAAQQLRGRYTEISADDSDINYLLSSPPALDETEKTIRRFDTWQEDGHWLIVLILPIASLAFRRGWLNCILLTLLLTTTNPLQASPWVDLWQTRDQQGATAMNNHQSAKASEIFRSPSWKASAQYKSGQYEQAESSFAQIANSEDPQIKTGLNLSDIHYNRGNALAQTGKYEKAITAYQLAITLNPKNRDAQFNKTLIEKLFQQKSQSGSDLNSTEEKQNKQPQESETTQDKTKRQPHQQNKPNPHHKGPQHNGPQQEHLDDQKPQASHKASAKPRPFARTNPLTEKAPSIGPLVDKEPMSNKQPLAKKLKPQELPPKNLTPKEQETLKQWLRQVDADPGGLLRRKFALQAEVYTVDYFSVAEPW